MIPASATRHAMMALAHPARSRALAICNAGDRRGTGAFAARSNPRRVLAARSIRPAHRRSICAHRCSAAAIPDRPRPSMRGPMLQVAMRATMSNPWRGARGLCLVFSRRCTSNCAWRRDRRGNTNGRPRGSAPFGPDRHLSAVLAPCAPWQHPPPRRRNWFPPKRWRISLRRISLNGLTWPSPVMIRDASRPEFSLKTWVVMGRNSGAGRA